MKIDKSELIQQKISKWIPSEYVALLIVCLEPIGEAIKFAFEHSPKKLYEKNKRQSCLLVAMGGGNMI